MLALARRVLRLFDAVLLFFSRVGRATLTYLFALLAAPVLAGSVWWFWKDQDARLKLLDTNKVTSSDQLAGGTYVMVALVTVVVVTVAIHFAWTFRKGASFTTLAQRAGAFLTPFLATPFIVALFQKGVEKESPKLTLFFCAIIAAIAGVSAYKLSRFGEIEFEDARRSKMFRWASSGVTWLVLLGMWAGYAWFFTNLSITNHHAFGTRTIDLGLYDNIFYQSSHGRPLACTFIKSGYHGSAHFDPLLVLLSPLYLLYPRTEFILGLQSVWCGSGVIPVFLIGRHYLQSRPLSLFLAAAYALHPALHGANMYEFHSLTLATVPLLWTLWALMTRHLKLYWLFLVIAVMVREDIPLMMVPVGAIAILLAEKTLRRTGFFTIVFCAAYFVIVKKFFMTSSDVIMSGPQAYSYGYYYSEMIPDKKGGLSGLVLSVLTNPTFALRHALEEPKVIYMITVFLPVLFLPFFARSWRMALAYGIAFTTLATRPAVFSTHFQYTNAILPFMFAALPLGLKQLSEGTLAGAYKLDTTRFRRALVFATFAAALFTSYKFGAFWENTGFKGGFVRLTRSLTPEQEAQYKWLEDTKKNIPANASVGVTQKMGPHVSNRKDVYLYGQRMVQYILIDERELKGQRQKRHRQLVGDKTLELVSKHKTYALYIDTRMSKKPKQNAPAPAPAPEDEEGNVEDVLGDEPQE